MEAANHMAKKQICLASLLRWILQGQVHLRPAEAAPWHGSAQPLGSLMKLNSSIHPSIFSPAGSRRGPGVYPAAFRQEWGGSPRIAGPMQPQPFTPWSANSPTFGQRERGGGAAQESPWSPGDSYGNILSLRQQCCCASVVPNWTLFNDCLRAFLNKPGACPRQGNTSFELEETWHQLAQPNPQRAEDVSAHSECTWPLSPLQLRVSNQVCKFISSYLILSYLNMFNFQGRSTRRTLRLTSAKGNLDNHESYKWILIMYQ